MNENNHSIQIEVVVNDVGDGDAILIGLKRPERSCIVVLDGGRARDATAVYPVLEEMLQRYKKKAPDLFIGTHYDNDHIAGLLPLMQNFAAHPGRLWMFDTTRTSQIMKENIPKKSPPSESFLPSENDIAAGGDYGPALSVPREQLLTSLQKEQEIREFAAKLGWPIEEPIAGHCQLEGWPELTILGPTMDFYQSLFPKALPAETLLQGMADDLAGRKANPITNPCARFDCFHPKTSRINSLSSIILIHSDGKKYLFTGDAGVDSFEHIPNYQQQLANLQWLKQPHHGSSNNFNLELLTLMAPKQIVVSGDEYTDSGLLSCLRSRCKDVRTTKESGTIHYTNEDLK